MQKYNLLIIVILLLSSCQSEEAKFTNAEQSFAKAWGDLYSYMPFVPSAIYDVKKLKDEKPFLEKTLSELSAIDEEQIPEAKRVEFFEIKKLVEKRIDFLENKIKKDPSVFSLKKDLEYFINEDSRAIGERSADILKTLERFPKLYEFAKKSIHQPELERVDLSLEEQREAYFLLKNKLSEWNDNNASTGLAKNHFAKKNREAQLVIKDWIAFLNSAKFEIGDAKGEQKSDVISE